MASSSEHDDQPGLPSGIFPERNVEEDRSALLRAGFKAWYERLLVSPLDVKKCEELVENTLTHPALKLLVRAMESSGCRFNVKRHISCEPCNHDRVLGAYDPKYNQVVVCANVCRKQADAYGVLGYNLVQMFDACRAHVNFRNIDHVACTEIRANNLFVCGNYGEARRLRVAPLFNYEGTQPDCVRNQAIASVQQLMNVDEPTARAAVDRVFSRCYGDLEPFGQRVLNENVAEILYHRRRNYGYY